MQVNETCFAAKAETKISHIERSLLIDSSYRIQKAYTIFAGIPECQAKK